MKIFAVIPARGGSKGIKDKNMQMVGDFTLIERALLYASKSRLISGVVVSSDSRIILEEARRVYQEKNAMVFNLDADLQKLAVFNANQLPILFLHTRESFLGKDNSRIIDTLKAVFLLLKNRFESDSIGILLLQPTSPFRDVDEIDTFLSNFIHKNTILPAVSVRLVGDAHPSRMYKTVDGELVHSGVEKADEFSPRQELHPFYLRDGSFYLLDEGMILTGTPVKSQSKYFIREFPLTLNIDTPADLLLSRTLLAEGFWVENLP